VRGAAKFFTYEAYVSDAVLDETRKTVQYQAWKDFQKGHEMEVTAQRGFAALRIESP